MRRRDPVDPCGQVEIGCGEPVPGVMRRDGEPHMVPAQVDVRMMPDEPFDVRDVHDQRDTAVVANLERAGDHVSLANPAR